jgi:hypothetical protein
MNLCAYMMGDKPNDTFAIGRSEMLAYRTIRSRSIHNRPSG